MAARWHRPLGTPVLIPSDRFQLPLPKPIFFRSLQKHAFDDDELRLLEILSAHLEMAINNAQQAEALRQALAEMERRKNRLQAEVERAHILRVLAETNGIIEGPRGTAQILGLHPNTLRFRLQKLGIKSPRRRL